MGVHGGFLMLLENRSNKNKSVLEMIQFFREEIKNEMNIDVATAYGFMKDIIYKDGEWFPPPLEDEIPDNEKEKAKDWLLDTLLNDTSNNNEVNKIVKANSSVIVGFTRNSAGSWERIDVLHFMKCSKKENISLSFTDSIYELFECS